MNGNAIALNTLHCTTTVRMPELAAVCRRLVTRQVQELQQFIVTRPEKTNNTYWPLEEKLLVGVRQAALAYKAQVL